ncbi:DUF1983 domain-containing protein [Aeromonas caviae]|uniref:phage tail tip fiber protein n=1 Tax=Aeromonas caviae TaxID=648 RepID=UPI001BD6DE83|nr:phage tail protein [Aeromonas caviae]MBS4707295.1 DUF1983 domain-containing protein [Aeromonas caviae]
MEIFTAVMMVVMAAMTIISMSKMKAYDMEDSGVEIPDAGANKSKDIVYGQSRIQCNKVFERVGKEGYNQWWKNLKNQHGQEYVPVPVTETREGDWLTYVVDIGEGPMNALKQIYINGSPALNGNWANYIKQVDAQCGTIGRDMIEERFNKHVQIQFNLGQNEFFYTMVNDLHPEWDDTCIGKNVASLALRIRRDPYKGEIQGPPTIEVEVEGKTIRDIRREGSGYVYDTSYGTVGNNPALCIYDYWTAPYGLNMPEEQMDVDSFARIANDFDKSNTKINGVVDQSKRCNENAKALQTDFFCTVVRKANKWTLVSWQPDTIAEYFTEDDILDDDVKFTWGASKANFNQLQVTYAVQENMYQKDVLTYPTLTNDELVARDGHVTPQRVEVKYVTSKEQIDRYASVYYETMRKVGVLAFTGNRKAFNCTVGDVVAVTHDKLQFKNKLFRVMTVKRGTTVDKQAVAELTLAEYNADVFDMNHVSNSGSTVNEPIRVIPEPHNLKFKVAQVGDTYRGLLEWDRVQCWDFLEYVVEYKLSSQPNTEWEYYGKTATNSIYINDMNGARYDFRVFTRTKFNRHSNFAYLYKVDVQDDTILPTVTGLKLITANKDSTVTDTRNFVVTWDSMHDVPVRPDTQMNPNALGHQTVKNVIKCYEVEVSHGANGGVYKRTVNCVDNKFEYTFNQNTEDGVSRYVTFKVRIVSKGGAKSFTPAILSCKNNQAMQPNITSSTGDPSGVQLVWDKCLEEDYLGTKVYISKTKGFVPTDADIPERGIITETHFFMASLSGKFYARVAHYDVFGADELKYSPEFELNALSVKDQMTKQDDEMMLAVKNQIAGVVSNTDTKIQTAKNEFNTKLQTAQADLNKAIKGSVDAVVADLDKEVTDRGAAIKEVKKTITDTADKIALDIKALKTESDANDAKHTASITATNAALTDKEKALAKRIDDLTATSNANDVKHTASITATNTALTDKEKALAKRIDDLTATSNANDVKHTASITATNAALTDKEKALAQRITDTTASLTKAITDGDNKASTDLSASVNKLEDAYIAADAVVSKSVQTVSAKVGTLEGKVTTTQSAIADINGKLDMSYSASISADGVFGGWSLIGSTATKESAFVVMADKFVVVNPKNTKLKVGAFEIRDGNVMIPNALIDDLGAANIRAGSITFDCMEGNFADIVAAHIKDGTIDFAKISDQIQSRNYQADRSGWMANKAGYFEASNAKIRGTITASDISGCIIRGAMVITDSNTSALVPTDADGRGGNVYVCEAGADMSASVGAINASYVWTNWSPIATYEYSAEGFTTSPAGTRVMQNTKRFRRAVAHYYYNGSATIDASVFNSVYLEWILHNSASQQVAAQAGRVACTSQVHTTRGKQRDLRSPPALPVLQGNIGGISYRLHQTWYVTEHRTEGMDMYEFVHFYKYNSYVSKVEIWGEADINYTGQSNALRTRVQITPDNMAPSAGGGLVTINGFSMYTKGANY